MITVQLWKANKKLNPTKSENYDHTCFVLNHTLSLKCGIKNIY